MSSEMRSASGSLAAWYHQFWLGSDDWDLVKAGPLEAGIIFPAASGDGVLIYTATESGFVDVTLRFHPHEPGESVDDWEDVVQGSLTLPSAAVFALPTGSAGEDIELQLPSAGNYAFQLRAKGRTERDDEQDMDETYLVDLWPVQHVGETGAVKLTSQFSQLEHKGL